LSLRPTADLTVGTNLNERKLVSDLAVSKVVVTGAAQGIGAAIAARLAADGSSVAILDRQQDLAAETAAKVAADTGNTCVAVACDMTDRAQIPAAFAAAADAMGGLDGYIGNAGITRDRMFHKLSDRDWDQVIAVNLTGVFLGLQAAAPWLRGDGPGRVVLISSVVSSTGNLGQMNYVAAKAGVVGLVRTGALELARFGTTVNGVRPGFIETAMTAAMPQQAKQQMAANPLGRAGKPADIAGAVAFLCSTDASFITGHMLDVNGGLDFA
jgi:NAD(P)-dependent dehydrogenase (short-subunit alcohol dehydrogenase family)